MLEKLARRLANWDGQPFDECPGLYIGQARVVVEEMRTPIGAVANAGLQTECEGLSAIAIWDSMIDAILEGK